MLLVQERPTPMSDTDTKRLNMTLPKDQHLSLRRIALEEDTHMQNIVRALVSHYLEDPEFQAEITAQAKGLEG